MLNRDLAGLIKLPSWFSDVIPQLVKGAIDEANTRRAYNRKQREKLRDKGQRAISYLQRVGCGRRGDEADHAAQLGKGTQRLLAGGLSSAAAINSTIQRRKL